MTFKDKMEQYRRNINNSLGAVFEKSEPEILYGPMKYAVNIGGKRIRPILCMMFYKMLGGKDETVLKPALALELLHNFTLVHDDIMDDDDLRRNNETVHVKWDMSTGILSGDGIISIAYKILLKDKYVRSDDIIKVFTGGLLEVCEGQAYDKEFETKDEVSEAEYIKMINNKTAALLSVSAEMGALCANADDEMIESASRYGRALGLAFQIQDDLLDIAGEEKLLGKTYGSDVVEGKKTYLYILAKRLFSKDDLKTFNSIIKDPQTGRENILKIKNLYEKYHIMSKAENEAKRYIDEAISIINSIPETMDNSELKNFTEWMLNRKY